MLIFFSCSFLHTPIFIPLIDGTRYQATDKGPHTYDKDCSVIKCHSILTQLSIIPLIVSCCINNVSFMSFNSCSKSSTSACGLSLVATHLDSMKPNTSRSIPFPIFSPPFLLLHNIYPIVWPLQSYHRLSSLLLGAVWIVSFHCNSYDASIIESLKDSVYDEIKQVPFLHGMTILTFTCRPHPSQTKIALWWFKVLSIDRFLLQETQMIFMVSTSFMAKPQKDL